MYSPIMIDLTAFTLWLEGRGYTKRTIQQTNNRLVALHSCGGLTEDGFYQFISRERAAHPQPSFNATVNKYMSAVKNYLEFEGITWNHPPKRIKEHFRNPQVYSDEEINQIIEICKPKYRLYLSILSKAGLRPGEALKLTRNDINFQLKTFSIRNTKTYSDRVVPIHESLILELRSVTNNQLFNFTDTAVRKDVYRCCELLEIPKRSLNVFRHSAATRHLQNGANLLDVKQLFGWKRTDTVERYYHQSLTQLRLIIENDVLGFTQMSALKKLQIIGDRLKNALTPVKSDPELDYSVEESKDEIVIRVKKKQIVDSVKNRKLRLTPPSGSE